ncbi:exonuclease RNase T and DNA polymerase III [Trametopsis cervina]|nr:exonuclease RNase T and DNA polymerase III [Trametopsis cervina]
MTTTGAPSSLKYLLVLDFEATCGEQIRPMEIIEFPTLLYNVHEDKVEATFHEYIRPTVKPRLTNFCTELTGITQETVDAASTFPEVWERYQEFMKSHALLDPENANQFAFLTCGDWDLKTMLPNQLALVESTHGLDSSGNLISPYNKWINIKHGFMKHLGLPRHNPSMPIMLTRLKLKLEGRHHSGIDDCKNILSIVRKLREGGWDPATALPKVQ